MRKGWVAALVAVVVPVGTAAMAGVSGGSAADTCYQALAPAPDAHVLMACKTVASITNQVGAYCRIADDNDNTCSTADGRDIDSAEIASYEQSWVHRALTLQDALTAEAPLIDEQLGHTHNSFNASAYALPADGSLPSYYPTLTNQDPNQVYSLTDQLDMDVRVIEMDLHWVPSIYGSPATNGFWVTLCHGDGEQVPQTNAYVHVGCSTDRPAQDGFAEVRRWLDANPGQFLVIYLENQLYPAEPVATAEQGHDIAAALLQQAFGSLVFRPTGVSPGHCATIPYGESEQQMAATGARVMLVGNCGPGAWSQLVFQRGSTWDESGDPTAYSASDCAHDEQARSAGSTFRREFEDSTFVTAATGTPKPAVTPAQVATMVRCGVNIIGLDQLRPQDGRLAALVWSWAPGQPSTGACASTGADGRFHSQDCQVRLPAACASADGTTWTLTSRAVAWRNAARLCAEQFPGSSFAVPVNGFQAARLASTAAGRAAWLAYSDTSGRWLGSPAGS
jgi:hypothetical protein